MSGKRRFFATLTATVSLLAATCMAAFAAPANADVPSTGPILFEDDFTGAANAAPAAAWYDYSACTYDSSAAFGLIQCGNNETLDGSGHLRVPATPTAGSAIRTHFTAQYGTFSAWVKLPAEEGYWPAFWTLNNNPEGRTATTADPVGEVDVMETWTKFSHQNPGLTKALGHTWTGNGATDYHSPDNTCSLSGTGDAAYHKYSAKIEPGKVSYYVDDVQCGQNYVKDPAKIWGLGPDVARGNWMILDLAIGDAGGQQAAPTQPATMLVDRVEVRALDTTPPATTTTPPPSGTPAIESGATYKIENTCGGKVLGVTGSTVGEQVKTQDWTGAATQKWQAITTTGSYFKLKNVASGQTMNIAYSSTSNGAPVIQYTDNGGSNAEFTIAPGTNGIYEISAHNSGLFVDVSGANPAAGVGVIQWGHTGACSQQDRLIKL